jgi:hypothetical protein
MGESAYNYDHFDFDDYGPGVARNVRAGAQAPEETLWTLDGDPVSLSSLWADRPAVVEFGSITCPIFCEGSREMDRLAERDADDVRFVVVYAREAHPGGRYGPHRSDEAKRRAASDAVRAERIEREVLVDDVAGTVHRAFDALPNSAYLVGTDGVVAARWDWTDPDDLADRIDDLLAAGGRGADVDPSSVVDNFHDPSPSLLTTAVRTLRRAGDGSLRDFVVELPRLAWYRAVGKRR